ncbi:MAG: hypothetical protein JNL10_11115 [Verrucomicrobiales bacterium]|nr:hypothetical protein [Verrucomicrobiales bacterium]
MSLQRLVILLCLLSALGAGCSPYHGYKPETNPPPFTESPPETTRPQTSAPPGQPGSR